ncbi:MAG: hypothetical protein IJ408_03005 [Clostridia bacterium]|nr:hypothetical protein [Clostridia bacterium]
MQTNKQIKLFDRFKFNALPKLRYHTDEFQGDNGLFITDSKESFIVSFEKNMQMKDMIAEKSIDAQSVSFQCCKDGKYIHERRGCNFSDRCAFFHIEFEDDDGKTLYLPGQIVVSVDYKWSDGVEPILMKLVDSITLI